MKEELLHYIWRTKKFDNTLLTEQGQPLEILFSGKFNTNAGPDFLEAKIKIGDTIWAGHVEMHLKSSDWIKHKHQEDAAYNNVILHVVHENDQVIKDQNNVEIPALALKNLIAPEIYSKYNNLMNNAKWVSCQDRFQEIPELIKNVWKDRLIIDRLEDKTQLIKEDLEKSNWNWEQVFFLHLAMHLGTKVNKGPFRLLMQSISLNTLIKHRTSLHEIEALLFGQAGMLDEKFTDEYPNGLQQTYLFLQKKYDLVAIKKSVWNFLRLRPPNFPTIRIAQLARLVYQTEHLFSKCLAAKTVTELHNTFTIEIGQYWKDHFLFEKQSPKQSNKKVGKATVQNIIINTVVPFLFVYGKAKGLEKYVDKALNHLERIPAESNSIIKKWQQLGYDAENSMDSQALLQLKNKYCARKRCLECQIGHQLIK